MPVTVRPSPDRVGKNKDPSVSFGPGLFDAASKAWTVDVPAHGMMPKTNKKIGKEDRRLLRTSFEDGLGNKDIVTYPNGFVTGIIRAFNQDLHLVLRPDDVWLAILSQFSLYVNGHAEEMRPFFVDYSGKRTVGVDMQPASLFEADLGVLAQRLADKVQENVIDPELKEWMIPNFTTTTDNDVSVASFVMLATLQPYFEYYFKCGCGFPSVTLLGEKSDWESIYTRITRLERYGTETSEWLRLLLPVLRSMVRSFDDPGGYGTKDFWMRACYQAGRAGSGAHATLSGWITAFCFWNEDGTHNRGFSYWELILEVTNSRLSFSDRLRLMLDGVWYPVIHQRSVPSTLISVPITIDDLSTSTRYSTTVMAGHVGVTLTEECTTVQPLSGWWMLQDSTKPLANKKT